MKSLAAAAFVLGVPALGSAQPTFTPPSPSPRGKAFELSLSVQGARDDNVLQLEPGGATQYVGDADARLDYRHGWRRSSFSLGAQAGTQRYSNLSDPGRLDYTGRGALDLGFSRRTRLALSQTYVSSNTRDIHELGDAGLVLPLAVTHRALSSASWERLGPRWQPGVQAAYERVEFPSGALISGENLTINPSLWRRLSRVYSIGVGYVFEQAWSEGLDGRMHAARVGFARRPAKGFGYRLEGGAAYLKESGKVTGIGLVEVAMSRRKDGAVARYERGVHEAFGFGRQVAMDLASLTLSRELARHVSVSARGTVGMNTDPTDPGFRYRSDTYTGALEWAVTRDLSARAGWTYWRSSVGTDVVTPSNRGWVSLGYRLGW